MTTTTSPSHPTPRCALVTGATSGIGMATARRLLADGWHVAVSGRDSAKLAALVEEAAGAAVALQADLEREEDAKQLPGRAAEALGGLDGMVHAAGILIGGSMTDTSLEVFDRTMNLNVRAAFILGQQAIPHLIKRPGSSIVHISSVSGMRAYPGVVAYCTSKAALDHLTRCMAIELAPHNVRVNAVNPGVVLTELHRRGGMSDAAYEAFLERCKTTHPLGRVGTPDEIASLIAYLMSPDAGWITGETISIDGGRHLTSAR
jgi:NAD(P)-dependent dehydrogenase (short-subunit alcohol dehydrogenase family)